MIKSVSLGLWMCAPIVWMFRWMCLAGGKAYQRDPVEECDSSAEKRHYAPTPSMWE